jgi:hypothetical protein
MDKILFNKEKINDSVNELLTSVIDYNIKENKSIGELNDKNKLLLEMNAKLTHELSQKDKMISNFQKTICDYEKQINSFNEIKEEENKFDMVKAKDKEVHEKNKTIESLNREINTLKSKLELLSNKNIECVIEDTSNVDTPVEDTPVEDTPVEDTPVEDTSNVDTPVEDTPVEDTPIEDSGDDQDSDEEIDVKTVTYRNKEYYLVNEDGIDKIFKIEGDESLGKELGTWVNNKLVKPEKKKKK